MSQIYRPAPRPAVKPPAPRPAMPMSRPAPRPMAKPTTPPPMGGMAGRGPAAAPRPVAKPQARPGMMGALQSRLQGARPQQKPMGQPEVQVRMPQGSGYTKTAANRIGQPMGQPAGELAVLRQEPAVLKAGPDYLVGQQQGMIEEREITKMADNYSTPRAEERYVDPSTGREVGQPTSGQQVMPDDMRRRQEMALRNRDITQAGRPMPMQGNAFAVAPQRLDMAQRLNSMFVPRG